MNCETFTLLILTVLQLCCTAQSAPQTHAVDSLGYVIYCPCMGRFGNQADHLLGSLSFAKKLNRTLVLPPFISHGSSANGYTPFKDLFDLETVGKYHKTIDMHEFMEKLAPDVWPEGKRDVYCHGASIGRSKDGKSCPAKEGSPFGPFWDSFDVDFDVSYSFKAGLSYHSPAYLWNQAYPAVDHPVLAFMGAPASYPVNEEDRKIQKYIDWTPSLNSTVSKFIKKKIKGPFVGIHLRNGRDWVRACDHISEEGLDYPFMSSPQCTGYARWSHEQSKRATPLTFTKEMCLPSRDHVKMQVMSAVQDHKAKALFIATDSDPMVADFKKLFKDNSLKVKIVRYDEDNLTIDMGVLMEADHFIGTCASSVTAFVVRKREVLGRSNSFFGVFPKIPIAHEEL